MRKLGVFEVDTFFPEKDRMALAMKLNGLVASPAFASWMEGAPLDIQQSAVGRRRQAAGVDHLPGAPLRGGAPVHRHAAPLEGRHLDAAPSREPATCGPSSTWTRSSASSPRRRSRRPRSRSSRCSSRRGRSASVCCCRPRTRSISTTRPCRTREPGASADSRPSGTRPGSSKRCSRPGRHRRRRARQPHLGPRKRQFLLHNTREPEPVLFTTRWALSYLRGPLTREQIEIPHRRPARRTADPRANPKHRRGGRNPRG